MKTCQFSSFGFHTHTFLNEPTVVENLAGQPVLVNQVGWGGLFMGRIDYYFGRKSEKKAINFTPEIVRN